MGLAIGSHNNKITQAVNFFLNDKFNKDLTSKGWKKLWTLQEAPRAKFFMWLFLHGRVIMWLFLDGRVGRNFGRNFASYYALNISLAKSCVF